MSSTATTAQAEPIQWPNSLELPLYVSIDQAAELAGVAREVMAAWVDAVADPIPHIRVGAKGRKRLIRTAAIPEYMRRKETR